MAIIGSGHQHSCTAASGLRHEMLLLTKEVILYMTQHKT